MWALLEEKSRSVPARAESFHTNENFVGTCCEFWHFFSSFVNEVSSLPKLSYNFVFQSRSVPARAESFHTNENFVRTCCEFWQ